MQRNVHVILGQGIPIARQLLFIPLPLHSADSLFLIIFCLYAWRFGAIALHTIFVRCHAMAMCTYTIFNSCPLIGHRSFELLRLTAQPIEMVEIPLIHGRHVVSTENPNLELRWPWALAVLVVLGIEALETGGHEVLELLVDDLLRTEVLRDLCLVAVVGDELGLRGQVDAVDVRVSVSQL